MRALLALILAAIFFLMPLNAMAEEMAAPSKNAPLALLDELYTGQKVLVFSPLSLSIALSMAAEGADGQTREQIDAFLGRKPDALVMEDLAYSGAETANAAFVRPEFELLAVYEEALFESYGAEAAQMDDGRVMDQVNEWVSEHTDGLIEQMLSEEPGAETMMLLINALTLKADWMEPFDPANTRPAVFHAPEGDIEVSGMNQNATLLYKEVDGIQSVVLPYAYSSLEMLILLPEDGGMKKMIEDISAAPDDFIEKYLPNESCLVKLSLPNVKAESEFELKDALIASGITDAFDPAVSDFTAMSPQAEELELYIGSVLQKAVLKVNEAGTEAAAATQVAMLARGALITKTAEMIVDRPFMMLIRDSINGYVLFAACINNPA